MERMFPRAHVFSHKEGPSGDPIIPYIFSQQQTIEANLNVTNFIDQARNHPRLIPTYKWTPVETRSLPCSANGQMGSNRKRQRQNPYKNDLKRQRFSSPGPQKRAVIDANFTTPSPTGPMRNRIAYNSPSTSSVSPISKPGTFTSPLRDTQPQNAFPPFVVKDKLSKQILELFYASEQQDEYLLKKEQCRAALQRDIQTIFPSAKVLLTGSSLNGFGSRSSDADLCLVIEEGSANQRKDAMYVLSQVRKLLYKLSYVEKPQLIRAKVPIIKFSDRFSGIEFDLNFNNTIGIRNTFLLRTYAYVEKRVRPIIFVIKEWASHHCINDASRGTLSSYTLVLMILNYLQTLPEPVIPCLQMDYPECFDPKMEIDYVPCGPSNIPNFVSKNQSSLGNLFLGFLRYYATIFKWDKHVISVREARAFPKTNSKEWRDKFICVEVLRGSAVQKRSQFHPAPQKIMIQKITNDHTGSRYVRINEPNGLNLDHLIILYNISFHLV
ncbi:hypothetical protein DNTS_021414 [Danionella cerebrum]|uniref:polynucleotide adenylyltransferase n=1 Tax=Danionella cerebrum TaxID=2873325 RepID=A0A553R140_9TELE|nr:hypothetical protein DNTS_021414 [Danionella translucida]